MSISSVKAVGDRLAQNIERVILGKHEEVMLALIGLLCEGHLLIEDVPGVGKTMLAKALARSVGGNFSRIQFTPDMLPSDVTGVSVFNQQTREFEFRPGPIMAQIVLADEINRATPKTQAALLEAMQEHTVTVAGTEHRMKEPFFVLATQNPFEMDGTYALPEAQIDRFFFKIVVDYPSESMLETILDQTTGAEITTGKQTITPQDILRFQQRVREVPIASHVRRAIARFVRSTLPSEPANPAAVREYVRFGISPRGAQAVVLAAKARALLDGRFNVSLDDVRFAVAPALRHRLQLNYRGAAEGLNVEEMLLELFDAQARAAIP